MPRIFFLRHGETDWNRDGRLQGNTETSLNARGRAQALRLSGHMRALAGTGVADLPFYSSPMRRTRQTMEILREGLELERDAYTAVDNLREIGFGAWEGRTAEQLRAEDPEQIRRFYHDPVRARPAGAEPLADFRARVVAAFDDLACRPAGQHLLVVTHAGVMRALVAHVLGAPLEAIYRIEVAYAALTRIRLDGERPPTLVAHAGGRV